MSTQSYTFVFSFSDTFQIVFFLCFESVAVVLIYIAGFFGLVHDLFVEEQTFQKGANILLKRRPLKK